MARLFAKALNAKGGPNVHPSDDDEISQAIMNGSCMDVVEIDGASNRSIDEIRKLREDCQYAPAQCTYKIYIIDEVHSLTSDAFNALLKTLEEPPKHVKFIFATTEAHKVLGTITSRCQRFEFRPIPEELIAKHLSEIAAKEKIEASDGAIRAIARLANGGMRDAQSILDQMISFCGTKLSVEDVIGVYGLASDGQISDILSNMARGDYAGVVKCVDGPRRERLRPLPRDVRHPNPPARGHDKVIFFGGVGFRRQAAYERADDAHARRPPRGGEGA